MGLPDEPFTEEEAKQEVDHILQGIEDDTRQQHGLTDYTIV